MTPQGDFPILRPSQSSNRSIDDEDIHPGPDPHGEGQSEEHGRLQSRIDPLPCATRDRRWLRRGRSLRVRGWNRGWRGRFGGTTDGHEWDRQL